MTTLGSARLPAVLIKPVVERFVKEFSNLELTFEMLSNGNVRVSLYQFSKDRGSFEPTPFTTIDFTPDQQYLMFTEFIAITRGRKP